MKESMMFELPHDDKGGNDSAKKELTPNPEDDVVLAEPKVVSKEVFDGFIEFIKNTIQEWNKIDPDLIFVGDSSAVPMGMALKEAYKNAFQKNPKFYRLAPRQQLWPEPILEGTFLQKRDWGFPVDKLTQKQREDNKELIGKMEKSLRNFDNLFKSMEEKENKKVIFYDESGSGPSQPTQFVKNGEKIEGVKEIQPTSTTGLALSFLEDAGFGNVWVNINCPKGYFQAIRSEGKNIVKKFSGPRKDGKRELAEEMLSDLKLAARIAVDGLANNPSKDSKE